MSGSVAARRAGSPAATVDRQALLAALVLAPATYSRNRFFDLYTDPEARRVRRRASILRSILRELSRTADRGGATSLHFSLDPSGGVALTYVVPALGLKRTAHLDALEASVVRFALAKAGSSIHGAAPIDPADRANVEAALARLSR